MSDLAFSLSDAPSWDRIRAAAYAWRGDMMDVFTRAELAVGETLCRAGHTGSKYRLCGPKFSKLAELVADGGDLASIGHQVRRELAAFRAYDSLRSTLCHGVMRVALDETGDWIAIFTMLVFGANGTQHEICVFDKGNALTRRDMLRARGAHLVGQLRAMQKHLPIERSPTSANCDRQPPLLSHTP